MKKAFRSIFLLLLLTAIALQKSYCQFGTPQLPFGNTNLDAQQKKICDEADNTSFLARKVVLGLSNPYWNDVFYRALKSVGAHPKEDGSDKCAVIKLVGYPKLFDVYKYILFDDVSNSYDLRTDVITRAFKSAYGIDASKDEIQDWQVKMKAKNTWYDIVLTALNQIQNQDTSLHKHSINRAYTRVIGRFPVNAEIQSAFARLANYDTEFWFLISGMYSGTAEAEKVLKETAIRSFTTGNKTYTNADLNDLINKSRANKLTYTDMRLWPDLIITPTTPF